MEEEGKRTSLMLTIENGHVGTARALIGATRAAEALDVLGSAIESGRRVRKGDRVRAKGTGRMGVVENGAGAGSCPYYDVRWDDGELSRWESRRDILHEMQATALMIASVKGMTGLMESLLAGGAKAEIVDEEGRRPSCSQGRRKKQRVSTKVGPEGF